MSYPGSKGWYIQQLKQNGINKHPIYAKKLETYKTWVVRKLYLELVVKKQPNA
jgi:hypothetical protein